MSERLNARSAPRDVAWDMALAEKPFVEHSMELLAQAAALLVMSAEEQKSIVNKEFYLLTGQPAPQEFVDTGMNDDEVTTVIASRVQALEADAGMRMAEADSTSQAILRSYYKNNLSI